MSFRFKYQNIEVFNMQIGNIRKLFTSIVLFIICFSLSVAPMNVGASSVIPLCAQATEDLVDEILSGPYCLTIALSSSPENTYHSLSNNHEIFAELETRSDAVEILMNRYDELIHSAYEDLSGEAYAQLLLVEIMLKQTFYCDQLNNSSVSTLSSTEQASPFCFVFCDVSYELADIDAKTLGNHPIELLYTDDEHSSAYYSFLEKQLFEECGTLTKLGEATARYNCHSYAWYQRSTYNTYWINDINPYTSDPHYYTVTKSTAQVGDVVVYLDSNNNPLHSAIIRSISTSNMVPIITCQSKMGPAGVYVHGIDVVPNAYTTTGDENGVVKYVIYHYSTDHTYTGESSSFNSTYHTSQCEYCDEVKNYTHTLSYTNTSSTHTATCSVCGEQFTSTHTLTYTKNAAKHTGTCSTCGYSFTGTHTYNSLTGACTVCGYVSDVGAINSSEPEAVAS